MSIDANVVGMCVLPSGAVRLTLEQPDPSRCSGQDSLLVGNPVYNIDILYGRAVWGGNSILLCGEIQIGRRVGYGGLILDADALDRVEATGAGLPRRSQKP